MLAPDRRGNYTDALRPPPGWQFDYAIAATYSLDLTTLLTFPLQLALVDAGRTIEEALRDGVALLEALRRTTAKLVVFCDQGRIHAPAMPRLLFSLLEPVVVETRAPQGGACHAKFWLLRFKSDGDIRLRLVVPTRNITNDRCWDLALTLEGVPTARGVAANRGLREILQVLPQAAQRALSTDTSQRIRDITDEAYRTQWELPPDFDAVVFHTIGTRRREWLPVESSRLVVISPFLTDAAVAALSETSNHPVALISRPETLATLPAATLRQFDRLNVLHEQTVPDDAQEPRPNTPPSHGLHAKAYILERGWDTHVITGSANATSAGLFGPNLEILVELIGKRSKVKGIDELLSAQALGAVLDNYEPPPEPVTLEPAVERALEALEIAQRRLGEAGLCVTCSAAGDEQFVCALQAPAPVPLEGIASVIAWPISLRDTVAGIDASPLKQGGAVTWNPASLMSVTGFIAFELTAAAAAESVRFVLNLPIVGLPYEQRESAILRSILSNREGFLRYLMLLLGEDDTLFASLIPGEGDSQAAFRGWSDSLPLLEEMSRALHRDPARLVSVRRLVAQLGQRNYDDVIPAEFLSLWAVFEEVLAEVHREN